MHTHTHTEIAASLLGQEMAVLPAALSFILQFDFKDANTVEQQRINGS